MGDRPPPPPPHGDTPKSGGLPPGKYDIFVIPEHSAGSGFLYLPSLQPNTNSFVAGFASALILVVLGQTMAPAFRTWWEGFQGIGNVGIAMLIIGVGFGAWSLGRTQQDKPQPRNDSGPAGGSGGSGRPGASSGFGGSFPGSAHSPHADGPPPPPPPHGSQRSGSYAGGGAPPPHGSTQNSGYHHEYASPPPRTESPRPAPPPPPPPRTDPPPQQQPPPPPPPRTDPPPQQQPPPPPPPRAEPPPTPKEEKPKPTFSKPPPKPQPQPQTQPAKPAPEASAKGAWEKAREQAKGSWEKAREETRKKEEERKVKEAEQKRREEASKRLAELRAKEAKERQQRELERQRKERELKDAQDRRDAEARAKDLAEKLERERKERERLEKEIKERTEREELRKKEKLEEEARKKKKEEEEAATARKGSSYAYSGVGEKMSMWPNGRPPVPASTTSQNTAQTSQSKKPPPPTARTHVSTDEQAHSYRPYDKPKKSARKNSVSSLGSESSWAHSHTTTRTSPPPSMRGAYTTKDPDKIVISAVYLFMNQYAKTPASQLISGIGSVTDGLILRITTEGLFIDDDVRGVPQREWDVKAWTLKSCETGEWKAKGLHILRATLRDQESKRYLFVIDEVEAWKVTVGLQRLQRGAQIRQVRQFGISGMTASDAKGTLEMLGWGT